MIIDPNWKKLFQGRELPNGVVVPDKVKPIYKNGVSDWIGIQPEDTKPILYISSIAGSGDWSEKRFIEKTGIKNRCFSYAYCSPSSPMKHNKHIRYLEWFLKRDARVFLDSGAHSLHRMARSGKTLARMVKVDKNQRTQFVEYLTEEFIKRYAEYVRWCYAVGYKFDFYVTLDSQRDCKIIWDNTKRLERLIGIPPVPVYHGDSSLDWVRKYIDAGHKLIGVGIDSKRVKGKEARHRYYSELHELTQKYGMATHGFAMTGDRMIRYPFYSVDSATHIKAASFGKILQFIPEKQRIAQIHISENYSKFTAYGNIASMSEGVKKQMVSEAEQRGFDFDDLVKNLNSRIIYNAAVLQEAVTKNKQNKIRSWGALV